MSHDAVQLPKSETKIIHKRRSSIFNAKTAAYQKNEGAGDEAASSSTDEYQSLPTKSCENDIIHETKITTTTSTLPCKTIEPFNLQRYIDKLMLEKKDWREEYMERKAKKRNIAKEKSIIECTGQEIQFSALVNYEQEFIRTRPKYEDILVNCKKLSNVVMEVSTLSQLLHKLNENIAVRMEENMYNVVKHIVEISEI